MKKQNFLILVSAFIILTYLSNTILNIDQLLVVSLSEEFTAKQIKQYINFQNSWNWALYAIMPILILIKISLIASVLYTGTYFFSKTPVSFSQLLDIVVKAEFVFLLTPIFKIIWFVFFQPNYSLQDIQLFYPLSALNIFNYKTLETWFIYPFQVLNLFEFLYWLVLAYYLGKTTQTNTDKGLRIVACSYGPALLLWMTTVMFFNVNYS